MVGDLRGPIRRLTPVQREVVALVRAGGTYETMAEATGMAERTLRLYVRDLAWLIPDSPAVPGHLPPLRRLERFALLWPQDLM